MKQNNVKTGQAAKSTSTPDTSKGLKGAVSSGYGRSTPVTMPVAPQTGRRNDLPGQK